MKRDFDTLAKENFDIIVVGGGILGAGIARDAALRGLNTVLLEKEDFGCGTTSRSSRLIHGGLRYLRQLEFRLVRQDLREREVLFRIAPHLVHPLVFIIPVTGRLQRITFAMGMYLYNLLSFDKSLPSHAYLSRQETLELEPYLHPVPWLGADEQEWHGGVAPSGSVRAFDPLVALARPLVAALRSAPAAYEPVRTALQREWSDLLGNTTQWATRDGRALTDFDCVLLGASLVYELIVIMSEPLEGDHPRLWFRRPVGHLKGGRDRQAGVVAITGRNAHQGTLDAAGNATQAAQSQRDCLGIIGARELGG